MKTWIPIITLFLTSVYISAQNNIGIGSSSPHASSILDLTSATQGFLFPRMTYVQRNAIGSPATGLLIYQTNSGGFPIQPSGVYFYDGTAWKRIARADELNSGGGSSSWTVNGDDQYGNLIGNVGIGTSNPTSKFHVVGSILQEGSTYALNHSSGILQFRNSGVNKTYVQLSGSNLRLGTNAGNTAGAVIFRLDGTERMVIDSFGDVGIGTSSPGAKFHVYGGSIKVERPGTIQGVPYSPNVHFVISDENNKSGGLYFSQDGSELANIYYVNRTTTPNILRFGISDPDGLDLAITDEARVGVNMNSVASSFEGQLHVRGESGVDEIALVKSVMGESPTIQFHSTTSAGLPDAKEAFVQLSNGDDLRLGTNSGNASGRIVMRMNGTDQAVLNPTGWMGIGTTVPYARLHLMDGQDADPHPLVGNGYLCIGDITSTNIAIDNNEIMARNYDGIATLTIQNDGGLVKIGNGSPASGARLHLTDGSGASLSQHGHVVLGEIGSTNITIDNNEIQSRNNGGNSILYLQRSGGNLDISGHTTINPGGSGEVLKLDASSPNIGFYHNGAYKSFIAQGSSNMVLGVNGGKIQLDGTQIAIGSVNTNASDYKLTVAGKVICEELKVELYAAWPDYVFANNYKLIPLDELKEFVKTNHHLPNIPNASEVASEGIELGEMNRKLLEKVEELTLYIFQLNEEVDKLKLFIGEK